jgi:benzoyl-CoA reductase/2-hydroxyglutaryl-CoA dehydratase subunit BcrC/BadD/HgdB
VQEFDALKARVEKFTGCSIDNAGIEASIEVYNNHAEVMRDFVKTANDHLDVITPLARHHVFRSALFVEKSEHAKLVKKVIDLLKERPIHKWTGKKVILSGITAEPDNFLELFEENGIAVVGDDLAQESRLYRTPIPAGGSPMERLAAQWFDRTGCSVIHEPSFTRGEMLVDMAAKSGADGVALCLMHFCDVEEYDYPLIQDAVQKAGLRLLCLEIDQSTQNNEQSRTKLQSFAEIEC